MGNDTCGRTDQQNPGKRESVGEPVADSNDILNFSETSERRSAGGFADTSHVKGGRGVTIESQPRSDSSEETLGTAQNGIWVHQNDPQIAVSLCSWLEHPRTELHSVAAFHRERLQRVVVV